MDTAPKTCSCPLGYCPGALPSDHPVWLSKREPRSKDLNKAWFDYIWECPPGNTSLGRYVSKNPIISVIYTLPRAANTSNRYNTKLLESADGLDVYEYCTFNRDSPSTLTWRQKKIFYRLTCRPGVLEDAYAACRMTEDMTAIKDESSASVQNTIGSASPSLPLVPLRRSATALPWSRGTTDQPDSSSFGPFAPPTAPAPRYQPAPIAVEYSNTISPSPSASNPAPVY